MAKRKSYTLLSTLVGEYFVGQEFLLIMFLFISAHKQINEI